jgi:L-threonylcarbamoyladenylate synthase
MLLLSVDPLRPDPEVLGRAAEVLHRGGLVAFPTETVYGLGAHALDRAAVRRIFAAKGRPSFNPLIVHVHDTEQLPRLVAAWPPAAQRLAAAFWPGPLTLVLPKREVVPDLVTAGLETVAVRIPAHPVALALLRAAALPIAAPSANRYTEVSPTTAQHVQKGLGERVDLILDGGPTHVGIESTVLDLSGSQPRLLRPGSISAREIAALIGPLATPGSPPAGSTPSDAPRPSPGLVGRHYAPRARLHLFDPADRDSAAALARDAALRGRRVGALLLAPLEAPIDHPVPMPDDPRDYAARLYAALHSLDDLHCDLVLVEAVPDTPGWAGIRDRLTRAASDAA